MKPERFIAFIACILLAAASSGWGQNIMSNQLNNVASTFRNSGMPQQYAKQYEALAKLRDPGLSGNTVYPLNAQMMQQAMQAIEDTQRRIDEINAQARQHMRQDSQRIRSAGDQAAKNINNQAEQALRNLDAIDRAETRLKPGPSKSERPDMEFGNYVQGRDKIIKFIGSAPIYGLEGANDEYESPSDETLKDALDGPPLMAPLEPDTFLPGAATKDLPNSFTEPVEGQSFGFTQDGGGSNVNGVFQSIEGTDGRVADNLPSVAPNTTGTIKGYAGAEGPWNDLGYSSKFDMGKDYVRMNDDLKDQQQIWNTAQRQEIRSNIAQLEAMSARNQALQQALNAPDITNVEAYGTVAGATMLVDGAIDTTFQVGGRFPGAVGASFKAADVFKTAGDSVLGVFFDGVTPGSTLDVLEVGGKAADGKLPKSVGPTINALKALNKIEGALNDGSISNSATQADIFSTVLGYGGVGKMAKGFDIATDASKLGGAVQDLRATAKVSGMNLKLRLEQEKKKLDDLSRRTAESLHDKKAKVEAIKRSDPDFAKQLDKLSYKPITP